MKTPKCAFSAPFSGSLHSSDPSRPTEQYAPSRRLASRSKRSLQLIAPSSASSSSYSKQTPVLNISYGSFSYSNPEKSSSVMSSCKAKNLLDSLGDLPTSEASKAPLSDPLSILDKRPYVDSSHVPNLKKAKDKSSTKPSNDSDPLSMWLEDCLPPLPPQPSPSFGHKSSSGSFHELHPPLGKGIVGPPSVAIQLGKSVLLPFNMNLHGARSDQDLVSTRV